MREHLNGERGEKKDKRESAVEHHGEVQSNGGDQRQRRVVLGVELSEEMNGRKRHQAGTLE